MIAEKRVYNFTGANHPGRSVFDLSYERIFDADFGQLIPVACEECLPGDVMELGNESIIRFNPLVAPILHEINVYTHYFFVPNRLVWDDWVEFITRGPDGEDDVVIPLWQPTTKTDTADWRASAPVGSAIGSLWDYFGLPTNIIPHVNCQPVDLPRRAYNIIWNEYYRDQDLQAEVALTNEAVLRRAWERDYFTSARPWQQRGTSPALPLSGTAPLDFSAAIGGDVAYNGDRIVLVNSTLNQLQSTGGGLNANLLLALNKGVADLTSATGADVADIRLAVQLQRWMELNARVGVRYVEFLSAHYGPGVAPRDETLQRPEYIGGTKSPVIVSEVLQTSQTDTTPQGNLAGHGINVQSGYIGKYRVREHGWIVGLMSVMPRTSYQQGINKQWLRRTVEDYYFPEYAHLSEQPIAPTEIYALDGTDNSLAVASPFGYQGRYDEYRTRDNMVCCGLRNTFDYWHMGRQFASAPSLNASFIECKPRLDCFAVPTVRPMIVSYGNMIKAIRPLPVMSMPGLLDHVV